MEHTSINYLIISLKGHIDINQMATKIPKALMVAPMSSSACSMYEKYEKGRSPESVSKLKGSRMMYPMRIPIGIN